MLQSGDKNDVTVRCSHSRRQYLRTVAGVSIASVAGLSGVGTATASGEEIWRFETDFEFFASPTVVDGTVFIGSVGGNVHALDADSGEERWRFGPCKHDFYSSPTVVDGTVFAASDGTGELTSRVYALDADSGEVCWHFQDEAFGKGFRSSPTVVDGILYIGSMAGNVHALDAESGEERWRFDAGGQYEKGVHSSPAVVDGTVFIGGEENVYALDADSGKERWRFETRGEVEASPTVVDGTVFIGSDDLLMYALDADSGERRWRTRTGDVGWGAPTVADGIVFFGLRELYALDTDSGEQRWQFETEKGIDTSPTVVDSTLFVGSIGGKVHALDADSGEERWRFETGDEIISSPTVVDGTLFVGSQDGNVYALDAGVDGSSEGSRARLGTLGHHDDWRYADQTITLDCSAGDISSDCTETATDDGGTETTANEVGSNGGVGEETDDSGAVTQTSEEGGGLGPMGMALIGGGGIASLLGGYALVRRSDVSPGDLRDGDSATDIVAPFVPYIGQSASDQANVRIILENRTTETKHVQITVDSSDDDQLLNHTYTLSPEKTDQSQAVPSSLARIHVATEEIPLTSTDYSPDIECDDGPANVRIRIHADEMTVDYEC